MAVTDFPRGMMAVLMTPFTDNESVDEGALRQLIDRVIAGGVHAVVALGTAGEFAAVSDDDRRRVLEITVEHVAGRVPVIAGTGEPGTRRAVARTQEAARLGVDGALVVPPYYYPCSQAAVLEHYRALAQDGGLPIVLYNIPQFTKVPIAVETVVELAQLPGIAGIKDSSGDQPNTQSLITAAAGPGFRVITGSDHLVYASLAWGADGCIGTGMNVAPQWFVALWDAAQAGRWEEAMGWQKRITDMQRSIGKADFPAGIKASLNLLGIGTPRVAAPRRSVNAEERAEIAAALKRLGLLN
ncbi:MAG: dihydrodipicolinate synthase family protein [Anaerolineae bacterium]|jgi:4-hydroxy-tetrahydrodipicolinate synthase|nr:dihydrodipicolinate synthase family protein [Chloroflexota bacterium]